MKELNLLGVVTQVSLSYTSVRDLVGKHDITLSNTKLRDQVIEILSSASDSGLCDYVEFKIAYGYPTEEIEAFLTSAWEKCAEENSAISEEIKPRVAIMDNGDHAVVWRLTYTVSNVFKMLSAKQSINRAAYELSLARNIGLNTPTTHEILRLPEPSSS